MIFLFSFLLDDCIAICFHFRKEKVSGFGLLPDIVPARAPGRCEAVAAIWRWTSTRYACPRRERRENRKNSDIAVCGKISVTPTLVLKFYFADELLFDFCITVFEPCDSVTGTIDYRFKRISVAATENQLSPNFFSKYTAL